MRGFESSGLAWLGCPPSQLGDSAAPVGSAATVVHLLVFEIGMYLFNSNVLLLSALAGIRSAWSCSSVGRDGRLVASREDVCVASSSAQWCTIATSLIAKVHVSGQLIHLAIGFGMPSQARASRVTLSITNADGEGVLWSESPRPLRLCVLDLHGASAASDQFPQPIPKRIAGTIPHLVATK